jgi:type VI secretion system protein ImpF
MTSFSASVWDRLIGPIQTSTGHQNPMPLTLEQYKRVIARDLEALLNTRVAFPENSPANSPQCRNSILNFGLTDFAQLCLSDSADRKEICDRLQAAIERHERRLAKVRVELLTETGMVNRLSFVISGQLRAVASNDRAQFDARLEQSSLHYSVC